MDVSVKTALMVFGVSLAAGVIFLLKMVFLCFKNNSIQKNTKVESMQKSENNNQEMIINVIANTNSSQSFETPQQLDKTKSPQSTASQDLVTSKRKKIINKKLDLSLVDSKYMKNNANDPLFTNYLVKSNRSFLGY